MQDGADTTGFDVDLVQVLLDGFSQAVIGVEIKTAARQVLVRNAFMDEVFPNPHCDPCWLTYRGKTNPCEPCLVREAYRSGASQVACIEGPDSRWFEVCAVPLRLSGRSDLVMETFVEITEHLHAVERYRASERRYRVMADAVQDNIWRADVPSLRITYSSPSSTRLFGYTPEQQVGRPLLDMLTPESARKAKEVILSALEEAASSREVTRRLEVEVVHAQGHRLWVDVAATLLRDEHGQPAEIVGLSRDISEHKRFERAIIEAKEAAEQAARFKTNLVSNVSHEMRTPLNGILGFAELVLSSSTLEEARQHARIIVQQSETLLAIVNDLLDHAKMREGKLALIEEPFDLREMLDDISLAAQMHAQSKGLEFQVICAESVPDFVRGDELRLRQILTNLVNNALKFTEKGGVIVRVSAIGAKDGKAIVQFSVVDTGIGIPKERQSAIFDSFEQADLTTTKRYGGTGLGTTIARQLTELMNGEIGLVSEPGMGSTFWVRVPLLVVHRSELGAERRNSGVASGTILGKARILVAEDYEINRILVKTHLEGAGHEVTLAQDGQEAVELAAVEKFDLIILDVHMPRLDGFEASRVIRSGVINGETPVLALTASADAHVRLQCLESGMDDVLAKPLRHAPFLAAVTKWLSRSGPEVEPEELEGASETSSLAPAVFDLEELVEQFGGNRGVALDTVRRFVSVSHKQIEQMRDVFVRGDREALRAHAHKIKGAAGSLTAAALHAVAARLEKLCAEAGAEVVDEAFAALLEERERFVLAVTPYLHE